MGHGGERDWQVHRGDHGAKNSSVRVGRVGLVQPWGWGECLCYKSVQAFARSGYPFPTSSEPNLNLS